MNPALEWAIPRIALLARGYSDELIPQMAETAWRNPGIPLVFQGHYGREQITRIDGEWDVRTAS